MYLSLVVEAMEEAVDVVLLDWDLPPQSHGMAATSAVRTTLSPTQAQDPSLHPTLHQQPLGPCFKLQP